VALSVLELEKTLSAELCQPEHTVELYRLSQQRAGNNKNKPANYNMEQYGYIIIN